MEEQNGKGESLTRHQVGEGKRKENNVWMHHITRGGVAWNGVQGLSGCSKAQGDEQGHDAFGWQ